MIKPNLIKVLIRAASGSGEPKSLIDRLKYKETEQSAFHLTSLNDEVKIRKISKPVSTKSITNNCIILEEDLFELYTFKASLQLQIILIEVGMILSRCRFLEINISRTSVASREKNLLLSVKFQCFIDTMSHTNHAFK